MKTVTRPILRYHGGKWRCAQRIISYFPDHRIYVEPYGGAGSVLLQKPRAFSEIYNDLDDEIVNLFQIFRDRGEELLRLLHLTPYARKEFLKSYEPCEDTLERARRTVVRSYFNRGSDFTLRKADGDLMMGGFRMKMSQSSTAQREWANYPSAAEAIVERLRGVVIECMPAIEVIRRHSASDSLVYVDPPYVSGTRTRGQNYRHEMTDEDHRELSHCLENSGGGGLFFQVTEATSTTNFMAIGNALISLVTRMALLIVSKACGLRTLIFLFLTCFRIHYVDQRKTL